MTSTTISSTGRLDIAFSKRIFKPRIKLKNQTPPKRDLAVYGNFTVEEAFSCKIIGDEDDTEHDKSIVSMELIETGD